MDQPENSKRLSETVLKRALRSTSVGFWHWTLRTDEFIINQYNQQAAELLEARLDDRLCMSAPVEAFIHPEDLSHFKACADTYLKHNGSNNGLFEVEHRIRTPIHSQTQDWIWVAARGDVVERDEQGNPIQIAGTYWDITANKQSEMALATSEASYKLLLSSISDTVLITDDNGEFKFICPNIHVIFGYTDHEVRQLGNLRTLLGLDLIKQHPFEALKEIPNIEIQIADKNGIPHVLLVNMKSIDLYGGTILFTCRDISVRRRVEETLRQSEEMYRIIVDTAQEGIWVLDQTYVTTYANQRLAEIFGYTVDEMLGKNMFEFLEEALHEDVQQNIQIRQRKGAVKVERKWKHKTGRDVWTIVSASNLYDAQGNQMGVLSLVNDITQRKQAETRLQHQHDFQRLLIELATNFINIPTEQLDDAINHALKEVGEFLGGIRCTINVLDNDTPQFMRAYEWHRPDIPSLRGTISPILDPDKVLRRLADGENVVISNQSQLEGLPDLTRELGKIGAQAVVLVPINREGQLREVVSLTWDHPMPIEPESIDLIQVLGEIYLNAVERKDSEEKLRSLNLELEQRVEERTAQLSAANNQLQVEVTERRLAQDAEHEQRVFAEALHDTAMLLNSTLKLDEVLDSILIHIDRVVKHDVANIMLVEGESARIVRYRGYTSATEQKIIDELRFPVSSLTSLAAMVKTKQPLLIADVDTYPGWVKVPKLDWLHSYLGVPICLEDDVIGFLGLDSAVPDFFTPEHAEHLKAFAAQAAIAIKNARLYEQANTIAALEERQRLARELHDSVSQMLFSANSIAEALPQILDKHPEKARHYLANLHDFTRSAIGEMRSLLMELRPEALTRMELGMLLGQLCDAFTNRTQITVESHISIRKQFPPEIQIAFYRIAQESFNNIAKHAQATYVGIELQWINGWLTMIVRDNGKGFAPAATPMDHFGIQIMQERALGIQAECEVRSTPGSGTEIVVRWQHGSPN